MSKIRKISEVDNNHGPSEDVSRDDRRRKKNTDVSYTLQDLLNTLNAKLLEELQLGLQQFISYIENWKMPADGSPNPIVFEYLKASPECSEFFQIWDDESSDYDVLKKGRTLIWTELMTSLALILYHNRSDETKFTNFTVGSRIFRSESYLKTVYRQLESRNPESALMLLIAIVRRGKGAMKEVVQSFDWTHKGFSYLLKSMKAETSALMFQLITALLRTGRGQVISLVLENDDMRNGIMNHISQQPVPVIRSLLNALLKHVILNPKFARFKKHIVMTGVFLVAIASLHYHDNADVVKSADRFLMQSLCSTKNGLCYDTSNEKAIHFRDKSLNKLLQFFKTTKNQKSQKLVAKILELTPENISKFFSENVDFFWPDLSFKFIASISLLSRIISRPVPIDFLNSERVQVSHLANTIFPPILTNDWFTRALNSQHSLVIYCSLNLILLILNKLFYLQRLNVPKIATMLPIATEMLRQNLPSTASLIKLYKKITLNLQSAHSKLIYYRILQLLAIYQQTFVNSFSEATFLVEVFKVDLSLLPVDLQYQSIQLLYTSNMKWLVSLPSFTLEPLFKVLLSTTHSTIYKSLFSLLMKTFLGTSIFNGCESEPEIWIRCLDTNCIKYLDSLLTNCYLKSSTYYQHLHTSLEKFQRNFTGNSLVTLETHSTENALPISIVLVAGLLEIKNDRYKEREYLLKVMFEILHTQSTPIPLTCLLHYVIYELKVALPSEFVNFYYYLLKLTDKNYVAPVTKFHGKVSVKEMTSHMLHNLQDNLFSYKINFTMPFSLVLSSAVFNPESQVRNILETSLQQFLTRVTSEDRNVVVNVIKYLLLHIEMCAVRHIESVPSYLFNLLSTIILHCHKIFNEETSIEISQIILTFPIFQEFFLTNSNVNFVNSNLGNILSCIFQGVSKNSTIHTTVMSHASFYIEKIEKHLENFSDNDALDLFKVTYHLFPSDKLAGIVKNLFAFCSSTGKIFPLLQDLLVWGVSGDGSTPFDSEKKSGEISMKFQIDAQDFENLLQIAQKSEHFDEFILRILTASLSTQDTHVSPGIFTVISEEYISHLFENINETKSEILSLLVKTSEFVVNLFMKNIKKVQKEVIEADVPTFPTESEEFMVNLSNFADIDTWFSAVSNHIPSITNQTVMLIPSLNSFLQMAAHRDTTGHILNFCIDYYRPILLRQILLPSPIADPVHARTIQKYGVELLLKLLQVQPVKESRVRNILKHFLQLENMVSRDQLEILQYIVLESDMGLENEFIIKLFQILCDHVYSGHVSNEDMQEYLENIILSYFEDLLPSILLEKEFQLEIRHFLQKSANYIENVSVVKFIYNILNILSSSSEKKNFLKLDKLHTTLVSHSYLDSIFAIDIFSQDEKNVSHKLFFVGILYKIYMMRTKACREEMLPKLLRAYYGSMHPVDQILLKIFYIYERVGYGVANVGYIWGKSREQFEKRQSSVSIELSEAAKINANIALFEGELLDNHRIKQTIRNFPLNKPLYSGFFLNFQLEYSSSPDHQLYDPSFLLPFLHHVTQFFTLDLKKFLSLNLIGYLIASLSSEHQDVRFLSYNILGTLRPMIEEQTSLVSQVLKNLANSVSEPYKKFPALLTSWVAQAIPVSMETDHFNFVPIVKALTKYATIEPDKIRFFNKLFEEQSEHFSKQQIWTLTLLRDGIRTYEDMKIGQMSRIYTKMMGAFYTCNEATQNLILEVFLRTVKTGTNAKIMLLKKGFVSWLSLICTQSPHHRYSVISLLSHFTSPQELFSRNLSILTSAISMLRLLSGLEPSLYESQHFVEPLIHILSFCISHLRQSPQLVEIPPWEIIQLIRHVTNSQNLISLICNNPYPIYKAEISGDYVDVIEWTIAAIRRHVILTENETPMSTPKLREELLQDFLQSLNKKWNRQIQLALLERRRFVRDLMYFFNLKSILSQKSVQLLNESAIMLLLAEITTSEGIQRVTSSSMLRVIINEVLPNLLIHFPHPDSHHTCESEEALWASTLISTFLTEFFTNSQKIPKQFLEILLQNCKNSMFFEVQQYAKKELMVLLTSVEEMPEHAKKMEGDKVEIETSLAWRHNTHLENSVHFVVKPKGG